MIHVKKSPDKMMALIVEHLYAITLRKFWAMIAVSFHQILRFTIFDTLRPDQRYVKCFKFILAYS